MRYLHTMIRVQDLDVALDFYCNKLGLVETRRKENEKGRFTLIFLAAEKDLKVDNIHETCSALMNAGVTILRPPREGNMAFVKCPDGISIELLQDGDALEPCEPWVSMPNTGSW